MPYISTLEPLKEVFPDPEAQPDKSPNKQHDSNSVLFIFHLISLGALKAPMNWHTDQAIISNLAIPNARVLAPAFWKMI